VGFAKTLDENGREWAGLSCSACHTTQMHYQGTRVRVEGGQGLVEFAALVDASVAALEATWRNADRFEKFSHAVLGNAWNEAAARDLRGEVQEYAEFLSDLGARSRPAHRAGWGRIDAYTMLFNEYLGTALNDPRNYIVPRAPASIPSFWLVPQLEFCTYNGLIHDLMARDVAEISGVFGRASLTGTKPDEFHFASTGSPKSFYAIELLVQKLTPPKWPAQVFGEVDANLVKQGREIYLRERCADCHWGHDPDEYPRTAPNQFDRTFIKVTRTPVEEVGTDPWEVETFAQRMAYSGKLAPLTGGQEYVPASQLFITFLTGLVEDKLGALNLTPDELERLTFGREPGHFPEGPLTCYIAEPLAGIWATPPYLHNGSVPNLYELLLPPEQRSKTFHVGSRDYDPKRMGYVSEESLDSFELDTSIPGNSNSGHTYGTTITEKERRALLEYLKTF